MSDNRIQSLPENMEIMRHLTTLKLANNKIKRLPACLQPPYACVLLRPLELDGNPIMDPEADGRGGAGTAGGAGAGSGEEGGEEEEEEDDEDSDEDDDGADDGESGGEDDYM